MSTSPSAEHHLRLTTDAANTPASQGPTRSLRASHPRLEALHSTLMSRIDGIGSAFPLRLAQAYQPGRVTPPRVSVEPAAAPSVSSVESVVNARSTQRSQGIDRLVAGRVDVPISFPGDQLPTARPASRGGNLSFYSQPTDRNVAATAVSVGRMIDVTA